MPKLNLAVKSSGVLAVVPRQPVPGTALTGRNYS